MPGSAARNLYVTENGAALPKNWNGSSTLNNLRWVDFLKAHIEACGEALVRGVLLRGYFVWSLMDAFEWTKGYSRHFGLVSISYPTRRRLIKESSSWYAGLIRAFQEQYARLDQ